MYSIMIQHIITQQNYFSNLYPAKILDPSAKPFLST